MAFRLTPPQIQYLDEFGNPLAGGQLFFYKTGTNTLAQTFADSALTIPNANPIILDSNGSCPAPFLQRSQLYKIVLEDTDGATVFTVDPVSDPTATGESVTSSFSITDDAGTPRSLFLQTDGQNRFGIALDAVNESGNNAGSNFSITTYNDDGTANAVVMKINRASGVADFSQTPTFGGMSLFPPGLVAPFAMQNAPNGWLAADGTYYKRTDYQALFNAIGTLYGTTTSTNFRVPNLQGVFIRGIDGGRGLDPGRAFGSLQNDAVQNHDHTYIVSTLNNGNFYQSAASGTTPNVGGGPASTSGVTTGDGFSANVDSETRPKNVALFYCIKT